MVPNPPIILLKDYGRLGNRLLTFTNLAALANECNRPLINLSFADYAGYFAGTTGSQPPAFPTGAAASTRGLLRAAGLERSRRFFYSEKCCRWIAALATPFAADDLMEIGEDSPLLETLRRRRGVAIWKAWNLKLAPLVERHAGKLREYFRLAPAWEARLAQWRATQPQTGAAIGVHVRRGDYAAYQGGRYFFDHEFYIRRMRELRRQFDRAVRFVIFSDEAFDFQGCDGLEVSRGPGQEALDLFGLAGCQWIMGPPSTFSAWASWHGSVPLWHMTADEPVRLENFRVHRFA